jgi:ceramide glucosyltransferase
MIHFIVKAIQIVAVFGTASSSIYYLLCLWTAAGFVGERKAARGARSVGGHAAPFLPPVSILKPLKGVDPEIYQSFRSHCLQDYPEYEIIFGVSDPNDPAIESVEQLQAEFPGRRIHLVHCPKTLGSSVKVSNLAQMLALARYDHLIVNDSDIRVEVGYLRGVVAPLADSCVGLVTCLYRGVATATLGSQLEQLGISTDFCPGVLVARQVESGIRFGLGSTLVFRRAELERIGGFLSFVDYLADDYELGKRIAGLGLAVELSDVVVETYLPAYTMREFFSHQLRWARGVRDVRASGHLGLLFTFGMMWGLLAVIASRGAMWAWVALGITLALRFAVAMVVAGSVLEDRKGLKVFWLLPLRDLAAVAIWVASLSGHTVMWRGDRFRLKAGKLTRIPS